MPMARRCIPAGSYRSTRRPAASPPKIQRRLVYDALQQLPEDLADPLPDAVRLRLDLPSRRAALFAAHFPPDGTPIDLINRFDTPAQRRLIFEEAFLFQLGILARRRGAARRMQAASDRCRRSHSRVGAPRAAVQADAGAAAVAQGDRRGSAAPAADEPAAAGRRRRGQDHRRAAGIAGGDGERPAGGVHGSDRDSGGAAFREHHAAVAAVAVSRRAADRRHRRRGAQVAAGGNRVGRPAPGGRDARAGPGRRAIPAARSGGHRRAAPVRRAAAGDAPRRRACGRTCW